MLTIVSFGGGTDSTAMLIGMVERGEPAPHAIMFGDTGGEFPHTYEHIANFSSWLVEHGYPAVSSLRRNRQDGSWESLEEESRRRNTLPAIAYGFKTCSQKFKVEPQDKWLNNDPAIMASWAAGERARKLIGYDADEWWRMSNNYDDKKFVVEYPLVEWGWTRTDCVAAISRAGLKQPGKSSCFFCPHMKRHEVRAMRDRYPDLLARALAMEAGADLRSLKGLGRNWNWQSFIDQRELDLDPPEPEGPSDIHCDCFEAGEA